MIHSKLKEPTFKVKRYTCTCTFRGSNSTILLPHFSVGVKLLKERICSSRSKFFPLRVDPISNSFANQEKKKQGFMRVNISGTGIYIRARMFIRIIWKLFF